MNNETDKTTDNLINSQRILATSEMLLQALCTKKNKLWETRENIDKSIYNIDKVINSLRPMITSLEEGKESTTHIINLLNRIEFIL